MGRIPCLLIVVVLWVLALLLVHSCKDNGGPVTPPDTTTAGIPQHQIPWPGLAPTPWPVARHDAQCTGRSQYRGPQIGNVKALLHPTYDCTVPVVGADSLFYVGSGGALLAISFTGNTRWSVVLAEARFQSPPVLLLDGTAFIMYDKGYLLRLNDTTRLSSGLPSGSYMRQVGVGKDGTIYAVGGANGTLCAVHGSSFLWSRMAPGGGSFNGNGMAGIVISPDGNTIYVPAGLRPSLVALDVNGSVLWSDTLVGGVMGVPAVDNAGNLFLWTRDSLTSLSPFGKRRWALFTGSGNWDLTIDCLGNIAYLAQGYLCSVQNNGKPRWKVKVDDADFFTSLVSDADGTVYCVTGSSGITNYNVRAVSLNGAVKWVLPISAYMKLGGLALTKEGYLLITDTGIDAGTVNSVFVIE